MLQQLSDRYRKATATLLFAICFNGMILPIQALAKQPGAVRCNDYKEAGYAAKKSSYPAASLVNNAGLVNSSSKLTEPAIRKDKAPVIGGPSQPEMSAFRTAGTTDMVDLFSGDFSYNIPLLDVGGYPVNIFYDGGVSMEQEASWVGLGWNINPGNVNRSTRGIPDDFNGEDVLKQTQIIKPNINWGVNLGADIEVVGLKEIFKGKIGASIGVSFNNYLGPALDIGIKGSTGLSVMSKTLGEKNAPTLGGSLSINASSRSGVTFTPGLSLTVNAFKTNKGATAGFGLGASTSYNSRTGIKAIQISEQMSFSKKEGTNRKGVTKDISHNSVGANILSSSISFNKPSYIPAMRMPMTNTAYSGHFQLGGAIFGVYPSFEVEVFKQKSEVSHEDEVQNKPMVGYLYLENAVNNANAIMDFTRVNDNEVTPSTPIISAPQYSYDVFSIQGEGTGGSVRAYRNDEGYVKDNITISRDKNISAGLDIGIPGQFGANVNIIKTPSTIGEWGAGNKLRTATGFTKASNSYENVYFRNPGENSVLNANQYDRIGGIDIVRYKLGGSNMSPTLEPVLEKFSKAGALLNTINIPATPIAPQRKKRTQVTSFLNAQEAAVVGLDKMIKSYNGITVLDAQNNLNYTSIPRFDGILRKKHHISQVNVTEANGERYVYGIPVYNIKQKDFTFTVNNGESTTDPDKVDFNPAEASVLNTGVKDGYLQTTETPGYAHSFLLSGLLSPDYVDVTNDGITEDDQGNAVKFNYTEMTGISKWRTPLTNDTKANFNGGKRTEIKDDKGLVSYGERESWYLHSIESKTMIALFKLEDRHDGKGSASELSGINAADNTTQRLKQIDLYSKADLKKNGISGAKPIKTVHFEYSYTLCKNVSNNTTAGEGKLTLDKIYFTFNGQNRASKNQYVFSYGTATGDNPDYAFNASDRWGNYKPTSVNPQALKNADYPYSLQDKNQKTTIDQNAAAWMLKKVLLPSGGQIEVAYESDDYAFVQNKRAAVMTQVVGFGNTTTAITDQLYTITGTGIVENNYAFIKVAEACSNINEVYQKYLSGVEQLSFKLAVQMPKGIEFIQSYATIDGLNYGIYTADATGTTIWIKLKQVDGLSPLSLTAIEFLREQLPGQAFPGYDVSESDGIAKVGDMLAGLLDGLSGAFKNPVSHLRQQGLAQVVTASKSFVRLNDPDGFKYGGGYRVKSVRLKDNWKEMNSGQLYTSEYGQEYTYTAKEIFNGVERTISSGVASYEPSLGGDENPFQTMVQVANKVPLGPSSYGAIEMPVLDAFFPSASVGYSKVTVKAVKKGIQDPSKKSRSGIGKQVTEFYTAKEFPVYYNNTSLDPTADKQASVNSFGAFFFKFAYDSRALSQGFLVEINDMHGKMKSQASYPENDDKTPINYMQNFYRNTGVNGMDEKFDFVYASQGGTISQGNMGIDAELMTDTREFSVKSKSLEIQGQLDLFPIVLPFWLPFIWPVSGSNENTYRAVTTTKVVIYHSVLDSVMVIDKGSQVGTKNMVYDAETGDVVVKRTNNEFKKSIYTTEYPAWWAYSGMGLAYKNIDAVYSGVKFREGKIVSGNVPAEVLESGDELYVTKQSNLVIVPPATPVPLNGSVTYVCNNTGGGAQGITQLNFNFSSPTTAPIRLIFGCIRTYANIPGFSAAEGCDEFTFPSTVFCGVYPPYPPAYFVDIPVNTTTYTTPYPGGIHTFNSSNPAPWSCPTDLSSAITDLYIKVEYSVSGYVSNLTLTNNNIVLHNVTAIPPNQTCITSSADVERLWVFDNNKNNPLFSFVPNYFIMDKDGKLFTKDNVTFKIIRSGKRNMLYSSVAKLETMASPVINNKLTIDNNSKVIDATAMDFKEKWQGDNDMFRRYDYVYDPLTCTVNESANCNGELEKRVNPYVKGILGNFKPFQSKVFYNNRKETDPLANTNIVANGFMDNFALYWDFIASFLYPNGQYNNNWVWNNQVSKVNSKGLELETKDAMGIYTSAEYGFNKTMPVTIASNSRYNEMFSEGFEEKDYNETLNGAVANACLKKHIDLSTMTNCNVVGEDQLTFNVHSGKNALQLNAGSTGQKQISIAEIITDEFDLSLQVASTGDLIDPGGNFEPLYYKDFYSPGPPVFNANFPAEALSFVDFNTLLTNPVITGFGNPSPLFSFSNLGSYTTGSSVVPGNPPLATCFGSGDKTIGGATTQYINVSLTGNYTFTIHQKDNNIGGAPMPAHQSYFYQKLIITRVSDGVMVDAFDGPGYLTQLDGGYRSGTTSKSIRLCSGTYKVTFLDYQNRSFDNNCLQTYISYYDCAQNFISNKSLLAQNVCSYTKPIPAKGAMINPVFTPQPGKKMLFSAWVRESCGNATTPCTIPTYSGSNVNIGFSDNTSITAPLMPSGPIIEGWQKIEGEFTIPAAVSSMTLSFNNNTGQAIYFDDIRIHPYNANVKSYVYNPINLRMVATLDANNYASFYEYDDEGALIRTKAETREGIKTITETRSAKQRSINVIQ